MKNNTRMLVEGGILIGLAIILDFIKLFQMPLGGSVTAGSMIPILIFAIRWGVKPGVTVGFVFGTLQFILGPKYSMHIVSILFDYSVAWMFLGVAGLFRKNIIGMAGGVLLAISLRFVSHVISGVVVFSSYTPEGQNPILYSMAYNGTYLGIEALVAIIVLASLYTPLKRFIMDPMVTS